jgi:hypothetical protein
MPEKAARTPIAIILAAFILGLSIIGARFVPRFAISSAVDAAGNAFVWRVNVRTGNIEACSLSPVDSSPDPFENIARGKQLAVKCK